MAASLRTIVFPQSKFCRPQVGVFIPILVLAHPTLCPGGGRPNLSVIYSSFQDCPSLDTQPFSNMKNITFYMGDPSSPDNIFPSGLKGQADI